MTEHYISFEQATILKELGFDNKVNHGYSQKIRIEPDLSYGTPKEIHSKDPKNYNDNRKGAGKGIQFYSAPRLDQAQAWLRDKWRIHVEPNFIYETKFEVVIKRQRGSIFKRAEKQFDSYEEALSFGIDEALNLLTDKSTSNDNKTI